MHRSPTPPPASASPGPQNGLGTRPGRVLVATDGSRCADNAVAFAIGEALATGRALDIVSVSIPLNPIVPTVAVTRVERYGGAREIVDAAARQASAAGVEEVTTHAPHGDPAVEILRLANAQKPSEIIVGRYGESTEATGLHGRVAPILAAGCGFTVTVIDGCRPDRQPVPGAAPGSSPRAPSRRLASS